MTHSFEITKNLFSSTTLGNVLQDRTTVYVEPNSTVLETTKLLSDNNILSVPVLKRSDGRVECIGFVSTLDLMLFLLDSIEKFLSGGQPNMDALTTTLQMTDVSAILDQKDAWARFAVSDSLLKTLGQFSKDVHRAPVWSDVGKDLVGIITQSDVVRFLNAYKMDESLQFAMNSKVSELGYTSELFTASAKESVFNILKMMRDKKMIALPLVNSKQEIVGCLSATDVRSLTVVHWPRVFDDAQDFLRTFHPSSLSPVTVSEESTFSEVLGKMESNKVHRLFVTDDSSHPIGVVTMTDVMRWLYMLLDRVQN